MTRLKKIVLEIKKIDGIFGVESRSAKEQKIMRFYEELEDECK